MPEVQPLLGDLVVGRYPVSEDAWGEFWDRLSAKELKPGEALAVVSALTARTPDGESVANLLASLRARNPKPETPPRPTVNIVGTGGGPSTFNLSTASAFVAGAIGARVVKTGSRAYASRTGSVDLLDRLGVPMTSSYEETEDMLERYGMACAGAFVYPKEVRLLARAVFPFPMKQVGRFFNLVGPFLGAVPTTAQITGVSDHSAIPMFRGLADGDTTKRYWIVSNELEADELLSIVDADVHDSGGDGPFTLRPSAIGLAGGTFEELKPVEDLDQTVDHFLRLIGGDGPTAAIESIKLNAGALAILGGVAEDWDDAFQKATHAMDAGAPAELIEQMRAHKTSAKAGTA